MIQALVNSQPAPKVIVNSRARQEPCRREVYFVLLCGAKAGSQARGGWSLVLTFNCSIYPWKRPGMGARRPWQEYEVSVHTVFGMGFNLAWFSSPSFPHRSTWLSTRLCSKARPQSMTSEGLLLGTGKLLGALALTPLVSPPSLNKGS